MPPVDFSVFTGAAQTPFGPDIQKVMQMQALQQRMQQLQQVQQGENALRALYQNPANVNPETNTLRPNALGQLMRVSPSAGQDYMAQAAQIEERQARGNYLKGQAYEKEQSVAHEIGSGALAHYNDLLPKVGPERALRQTNEWLGEKRDEAGKAGSLSPGSLEKFPRSFDPITFRSNEAAYNAAHTKPAPPITPFQRAELGIQDERLKGEGDARAEAAQHHRTMEDISRGKSKTETLTPSKEIAIIDKDGQVVERLAAREKSGETGFVRSDDGRPVTPPPGGRIELSAKSGGGRQAAQQAMAMLNAGNEASAALSNLVDLPISATAGLFKGVQFEKPEHLGEALKRTLTAHITPAESRSLQLTFQGVARSMATLEAAGRATGLVGLTQQAAATMPQSGDTNLNVLRSYAELRQIVERSLETMKSSPDVSADQKRLMDKIVEEVKGSVPWTVKDINALERGDTKTVADFAKKVSAAGAAGKEGRGAAERQPGAAQEVTEEQYNSLPPGAAYRVPGNPKVMYKQ